VKKQDGSLRFCVDYRRLNAITYMDSYLLPLIAKCVNALSGSWWYGALDFAILADPSVFERLDRRPLETSSQETGDEHENSARVAAISYGTASQNAVMFDCDSEAAFLFKRLPSVEKIEVGDGEVYCENPPVQLDSPAVHTVKFVTQKEGDVFGLAGGSLADEQEIGALVAMYLSGAMSPNSNEVETESELTKKLLWNDLVVKDGVVYRKKVKFKSGDAKIARKVKRAMR